MHPLETQTRTVIDNRICQEISDRFDEEHLNRIVRYSSERGGKRCRSILLLRCTEMLGGNRERAMDAASAIELIHTSSLIFDDITDHETARRNAKPLHLAYGQNAAITCGLFLASKGVEILSRYGNGNVMRVTGNAIAKLSEGEMLDVLSRQADSIEGYLKIATLKTGSLFAAAAAIGALLAGASEKQIESLSECGRLIGIAFQLRDDFLDMIQDACSQRIPKRITVDQVSRLLVDYAKKAKAQLTEEFGEKSHSLVEFVDFVCTRKE